MGTERVRRPGRHRGDGLAAQEAPADTVHRDVAVAGDQELKVGPEGLHGVDEEEAVHREGDVGVVGPPGEGGPDAGHLQLGDALALRLQLDGHVRDAELDDHQLGGLVDVLPRPPLGEDGEIGLLVVGSVRPRQKWVGGLG